MGGPLFEMLLALFTGTLTTAAGLLVSRTVKSAQKEETVIHEAVEALLDGKVRGGSKSSKTQPGGRFPSTEPERNDYELKKPLVEGVTKLVADYHNQGLSQAGTQFWFSIFAATVGFVWIIYAGLHFDAAKPATALKTLPGAVIDSVAALFFKQATETRQRATELYDRLRKDKQADDALELVNGISDDRARSAVKAQLALHMMGLTPAPLNIEFFMPATPHHLTEAQPL